MAKSRSITGDSLREDCRTMECDSKLKLYSTCSVMLRTKNWNGIPCLRSINITDELWGQKLCTLCKIMQKESRETGRYCTIWPNFSAVTTLNLASRSLLLSKSIRSSREAMYLLREPEKRSWWVNALKACWDGKRTVRILDNFCRSTRKTETSKSWRVLSKD